MTTPQHDPERPPDAYNVRIVDLLAFYEASDRIVILKMVQAFSLVLAIGLIVPTTVRAEQGDTALAVVFGIIAVLFAVVALIARRGLIWANKHRDGIERTMWEQATPVHREATSSEGTESVPSNDD